MLKKTILLLILTAIVAGGVFAEDSVWNTSFDFKSGPTPHKGALFVDLGYTLDYLWRWSSPGFGVGLGWEGRVNDSSTYLINGNIGLYKNNRYHDGGPDGRHGYTDFNFGIEANYRYYFFKSALDKLFINAGFGYGMGIQTNTWEHHKDETYIWGALYIPVYAGYKIIIGPGFVVEVHGGYRFGIGLNPSKDVIPPPFGWGNAIYGIAIGWAFK